MIVDVVTTNGEGLFRYESDIVPRVGETISTFRPNKSTLEVVQVDHLVDFRSSMKPRRQDLVTVTVRDVSQEKRGPQ